MHASLNESHALVPCFVRLFIPEYHPVFDKYHVETGAETRKYGRIFNSVKLRGVGAKRTIFFYTCRRLSEREGVGR